MTSEPQGTVLGDEYDEKLRDVLLDVLRELGFRHAGHERGHAGSQELETLVVEIDGKQLVVEAETYVGLSVRGDSVVVERVAAMVKARLQALSSPLDEFAVYLELSASRSYQQRVAEELGTTMADQLRRRWSGQVAAVGVTRSEVEARLGPPTHVEGSTIAYALRTRPGYVYTFRFGPDGTWRSSGFDREAAPVHPLPGAPPVLSWSEFIAQLARSGATAKEVRALVGPPGSVSGWWPVETWEYPDGWIELRHGIVEVVSD